MGGRPAALGQVEIEAGPLEYLPGPGRKGVVLLRGDYQAGVISSRRWVVLDPLSEDAHRKLMRLLVYAGNTADSQAQFETCCQILQDELGVGPSVETRQLYGQI